MIDLEQVRSVIAAGLYSHLNMPVVETDVEETPAAYPFIKYGFSGPVLFPDKPVSVTVIPSSTPDEVIERYTEQPSFRMTFLSCSDRPAASLTNAIRLHDWFRIFGYGELKRNANTVVVTAGDIQNRDVQIGSAWERRHGFEVTFRTTSIIDMQQPTIELINWK
ncbi:phage neck terminator protein [Paenibacillus piri]|uniref:Phage neck terminator protein gp12-like domain-containing protein n=1 Tax=Paenibacillus piri TaxID=2547395 RepID=A0A4R5KCE8_9BACL|nr:hypothetical protein [Paenibacillus piri]TDF92168.1 hypothetical protein E1757_30715 [Paenibacillus piri]